MEEAKNMGGNINLAWDEDAPFMGLDNNVLYFSSTDSTSMGGLISSWLFEMKIISGLILSTWDIQ